MDPSDPPNQNLSGLANFESVAAGSVNRLKQDPTVDLRNA